MISIKIDKKERMSFRHPFFIGLLLGLIAKRLQSLLDNLIDHARLIGSLTLGGSPGNGHPVTILILLGDTHLIDGVDGLPVNLDRSLAGQVANDAIVGLEDGADILDSTLDIGADGVQDADSDEADGLVDGDDSDVATVIHLLQRNVHHPVMDLHLTEIGLSDGRIEVLESLHGHFHFGLCQSQADIHCLSFSPSPWGLGFSIIGK